MKNKKVITSLCLLLIITIIGILIFFITREKTYTIEEMNSNSTHVASAMYTGKDKKGVSTLVIRVYEKDHPEQKKETSVRTYNLVYNNQKATNLVVDWVDQYNGYVYMKNPSENFSPREGYVIHIKDGIRIEKDDKTLEEYLTFKENETFGRGNTYPVQQEKSKCMYQISNMKVNVSYDEGQNFTEVPCSLSDMVEIEGDNVNYGSLQEGSYVIREDMSAFVYGGTEKTPLSVIYSNDKGKHWNTTVLRGLGKPFPVRVHYVSFPTNKIGYVVAGVNYFKGQESSVLYKTVDGGKTWKNHVIPNISYMIEFAGFDSEQTGVIFIRDLLGSMHKQYRTIDGGASFEEISLPVPKDFELSPLCFDDFKVQDNTISVHASMQYMGDADKSYFRSGIFYSETHGERWEFIKDQDSK